MGGASAPRLSFQIAVSDRTASGPKPLPQETSHGPRAAADVNGYPRTSVKSCASA
ncbi:hypothetical protein LG3211_1021 [Lysobacter gummosus]|nr:hypothetical protein LG3211_1021 [Lysobacter gummosus]